jgi:signal transduction histidine kinase
MASILRASASHAAEAAGGGLAMIFASVRELDGGEPPLRAAAGFASEDAVRIAAAAVEEMVAEALRSGQVQQGQPEVSLGERSSGGLWVAPLKIEGRNHGALVVGSPRNLQDAAGEILGSIADSIALRLEHAAVCERLERIESEFYEKNREHEEKSDEILKLSEALFAQDIELLRSSEELGKIEKLKSDFIEKMSRELRTPLNSIIECIISVLAGENENLSETAREALRCALDDGTTFLRTLQNILDLWRIKQGELPLECQEVNIREVVEEAIFNVQDTLGNKPVTIRKKLVEPIPKIRTDLAKVNQTLFLLLDNAAKFTPDGEIEIGVEMAGNRLRCSITDTGIGICQDDLEFIYDEFYQVDETHSSRYRGAGLGMTLVRDLLTLLDGEIQLSSEVGQGTRVCFEVPVQVIG